MPSTAEREIAARSALFVNMPRNLAERLLVEATTRRLGRGETLFLQGERADSLFVTIEGWVKLYRLASTGEEAVVQVFAPGESFAEAPAFEGTSYPVCAGAATDCVVLQMRASALLAMMDAHPPVARAIVAATYRHLQTLVLHIAELKGLSGPQRVAEFLLSLCAPGEGARRVTLPHDKTLIAGRLGMQPQSLSRAFVRLRAEGVTVRASEAEIADVGKLRRFIGRAAGED